MAMSKCKPFRKSEAQKVQNEFLRIAGLGIGIAIMGLSCSRQLPPPPSSQQQATSVAPPSHQSPPSTPPTKTLPQHADARDANMQSGTLTQRIAFLFENVDGTLRKEVLERRVEELLKAYPENMIARARITMAAADILGGYLEDRIGEQKHREDSVTLAKEVIIEGTVLEQRAQLKLARCLNAEDKREAAQNILKMMMTFRYFDTRWEPRTSELKETYRDAALLLVSITPLEDVHRLRFPPFVLAEIEQQYPEEYRRIPKALYIPGIEEIEDHARSVVESRLIHSSEGSELRRHLEATLKHLLESER